jgi:hypothetical protein
MWQAEMMATRRDMMGKWVDILAEAQRSVTNK